MTESHPPKADSDFIAINTVPGLAAKPTNSVDAILTPATRRFRELFKHKEARAAVGLFASIALGLAAREEYSAHTIQQLLTERITGLAGVDTGPSNVENLYYESLCALIFTLSAAYLAGGSAYESYIHNIGTKSGLASLPRSWKGLNIVDPNRLVFDSFAGLDCYKNKPLALIHDGTLLREGELEGGALSTRRRRHLNSLGKEHLSDARFLAKARPENVSGWVINAWTPDEALYSQSFNGKEPVNPYKIGNIVRTISSWPDQNVTIIAPQDLTILVNGKEYSLREYFNSQRFPDVGILQVVEPERVVTYDLVERLNGESIRILSDNPAVEAAFMRDLDARGGTTDSTEMANVIAVYCATDDIGIENCAELHRTFPKKTVIGLIERQPNIAEVQNAGGVPYLIPHIVASTISK